MFHLCKKQEILGKDCLKRFYISSFPEKRPKIDEKHQIICGIVEKDDELLIVCETLRDIQDLYKKYIKKTISEISWYYSEDPGFVIDNL